MSILGKIIYKYYHKPFSDLKDKGGFINYFLINAGQKAMKNASHHLKILGFEKLDTNTTVCALAGKNNWYQMIFCLYSFYKNLGYNLKTVIIDDGTLNDDFIKIIYQQIPYCEVKKNASVILDTQDFFEKNKLPVIAKHKEAYVVYRKIFHSLSLVKGKILILDADMLFYKFPKEIHEWIKNENTIPMYMPDVYSIYGEQTDALLENKLAEPLVNTGILGIDTMEVDWQRIEGLLNKYLEFGPINYLTEQGLYAMYLKGMAKIRLPDTDYIILPSREEAKNPKAIMHHFPTENRNFYFRYAWKNIDPVVK